VVEISHGATSPMTLAVGWARKAIAYGALALVVLGAIAAAAVYVTAPVDDLRRVVSYTPVGAATPRDAGLARPNVTLDELPDTLLLAVLFNEDKTFVEHRGFDLAEAGVSIREWIRRERRLRGASTITQQLARMIFLAPDRTVRRKLVEAAYTIKLERRFSKREILTLYLNNVEWGPRVYGVDAAAAHYFRKRPRHLTARECIFLAAILPSPARLTRGLDEGRLPYGAAVRIERLTAGVRRATELDGTIGTGDPVAGLMAAVRLLKDGGDAERPVS
jgi:penicillin-binding protein 1A